MGDSNVILISPTTCANRQNSWSHTYSPAQLRQLNTKVNQENRFQVLPPGTILQIRQLKINKKPIRMTEQICITNNHNWDNLVHIRVTKKIGTKTASTIRLTILNTSSVINKDEMIVNKFIKAKIDIVDIGLLTETWLKTHLKTKHGSTSQISHNQTSYRNSTTNRSTGREEDSNTITQEHQDYTSRIRPCTHN